MTSKLTITREQAQKIIDAADAVMSALAGTNDEVHKDDTDKMIGLWDDLNDRYAPPEVVRNLASMALAAMDSEPVAYMHDGEDGTEYNGHNEFSGGGKGIPLYRHAQPAPKLKPVGYLFVSDQGVIAYSPTDWGIPGFKLAGQIFGDIDVKAQPAPVVQCPFPCGWDNLNKLAIQDAAFVTLALVAGEPATESIRQAAISNNDRLLKVISACRAAMLNGGKS